MNVAELADNLYHVRMRVPDLGLTFMRFSDYRESPFFRGRFFTREEYQAWYTATSPQGKLTGRFTYGEDWSGFNIPSTSFTPFRRGQFNPLTDGEQALLHAFAHLNGRFYIIGTPHNGDPETLEHEIAHAFYFLDPDYRKTVDAIVKQLDRRNKQRAITLLRKDQYHPAVFRDEIQAYLLSPEWFVDTKKGEHEPPRGIVAATLQVRQAYERAYDRANIREAA